MKVKIALIFILLGCKVLQAQIPSYIPKDSLVGWWPFNGNANDESGNGNHGTVTGATLTKDRLGNQNKAYHCNMNNWSWGSGGDRIYIPFNSKFNSNKLTASIWFKRTSGGLSNGQGMCVFNRFQYGYNNPNGETFGSEIKNENLTTSDAKKLFVAIIEHGPSANKTAVTLSAKDSTIINNWYNFCFTFDSVYFKLYLNSVCVDSASVPKGFKINTQGNSGISLGVSMQANGEWGPLDGDLDDFAFWNRALTSKEVNSIYNNSCNIITTQISNINQQIGSTAKFSVSLNDTSANTNWQTSHVELPFTSIPNTTNYTQTSKELSIKNLTISNHNQKIRFIAKNSKCSDTSRIATISIKDNCSNCCGNKYCDESSNNSKIIGNWNFDGNLLDKSKFGDTAKRVLKSGSSVTYEYRQPNNDSNLVFSGSPSWNSYNSYVSIPLKSHLQTALQKEFSLSLWLNYNDTGNSSDILNTGNDNNGAFVIRKNPNNTIAVTNGAIFKPVNSRNKWNLLGANWDSLSKDLKLFWNGKLVSTSKLLKFSIATNEIRLGGHPGGSNGSYYPYIGKMDKLMLYNTKLDSSYFECLYKNSSNNSSSYFDTIRTTIYDTIRTTIYDTIAVQDTLIINAKLTGTTPLQTNLIKVYPNPAKDHLVIDFGNYSSMAGYEINIFDVAGKSVYSSSVNKQIETIDLSTWTGKGIYFLKIYDKQSNQIENRKIVIQ